MMFITDLPVEILIHIFTYLNLLDVVNLLKLNNKQINKILTSNYFNQKATRHIIEEINNSNVIDGISINKNNDMIYFLNVLNGPFKTYHKIINKQHGSTCIYELIKKGLFYFGTHHLLYEESHYLDGELLIQKKQNYDKGLLHGLSIILSEPNEKNEIFYEELMYDYNVLHGRYIKWEIIDDTSYMIISGNYTKDIKYGPWIYWKLYSFELNGPWECLPYKYGEYDEEGKKHKQWTYVIIDDFDRHDYKILSGEYNHGELTGQWQLIDYSEVDENSGRLHTIYFYNPEGVKKLRDYINICIDEELNI